MVFIDIGTKVSTLVNAFGAGRSEVSIGGINCKKGGKYFADK
jgi:hypothetical protein